MSVTAWEYRKALSDRLRAVWDTQRDGVLTWQQAYARAKAAVVARLHRDADTITSMTWDEFQRLQGWHDDPETPNVALSRGGTAETERAGASTPSAPTQG